jgi:hypothetical protein
MPAGALEHSDMDQLPVFVAVGQRRRHAAKFIAPAFGLLLLGWVVALAAGLVGFSPLPKLPIPGTEPTRSAPKVMDPASGRGAAAGQASAASAQSKAFGSSPGKRGTSDSKPASRSVVTQPESEAGGAPGGHASPSVSGGGGTTSPQPTKPPTPTNDPPSQPSSGHPPSFTPPATGDQSAAPPRGNSAGAPGRAISADPPGKRATPHPG